MTAALPRLDFLRPQRRLRRWWPVAAGAVLLMVVLGVTEFQRQAAERLRAAQPSARAPAPVPPPRRAAVDAATARHLAGLHHDWAADLSVLDGLRLPGLRWLRWEYEVAAREWQLEGEVEQLPDLLRLSRDLAPLGALQLQRVTIPQQAIRFDLRVQAVAPAHTSATGGPGPAARPAAWAPAGLQGFEPVAARPQRQAALLQHFRRSGLEAVQGEFRANEDGGGALDRVALQLSARGSMAALRHALADAMQADPGLALERLRLVRESPTADGVQAELRLALLSSRERAR